MSVEVSHQIRFDVKETLATGGSLRSGHTESQDGLSATTTPAVTKQAGGAHQLTAGAETLDLTAMANDAGGAVDMTGLKVQAVYIRITTATAPVVFAKGATNGYALFAASSGQIGLAAGEDVLLRFNESRPDVAAGAKTIDVSSADADAEYEIYLVAG